LDTGLTVEEPTQLNNPTGAVVFNNVTFILLQ
jgi:hypothetical protein